MTFLPLNMMRLCNFINFIEPCLVPYTANGFYSKVEPTYSNVSESTEFMDGEVVTITCLPGFNLKGPSRMECIKGDWDVGTAVSECTPGDISIELYY